MENTEQTQQSTNSTPRQSNLGVPIAIIIAGLIIGAAIIFTAPGTAPIAGERVDRGEDFQEPSVDLASFDIDEDELTTCVSEGRYDDRIQNQIDNATAMGGTGTPFWVVVSDGLPTIPLSGALPFETVDEIISIVASGELGENFPEVPELDTEPLPIDDMDIVRGPSDAPVTIIEYSDYDCPFCGRFHETMVRLMNERDDVNWVYRHLPLEQIHPDARNKANRAECIRELAGGDAFWAYSDQIFGL